MTEESNPKQSPLETMIGYSGEAMSPDVKFDIDLFKRLNAEYEATPVVPAPRPHHSDYATEIANKRGLMLDRKISIRDQRVLELGCGTGEMSRTLAKEFGCSVVGVDVDQYEQWSKPLEDDVQLLVHDISTNDNTDLGQFDRIISFAVLEHVIHPYAALEAAYDLLKPGGKAYIYANLYRGAKASHRYREVFFPWSHLLFETSVWQEFYIDLMGEPLEPAWVNKLTYDQYVNSMQRIGFQVLEHFPSPPYFDESFYQRFEYQLAAYPVFDLKHDFVHLVVSKPEE